MMRSTTLAELRDAAVLEFGDGYRTRRDQLAGNGFRILRAADIDRGAVSLTGEDFVAERYRAAIGSKVARKGDVVLTTKGTVGRVAVIPDVPENAVYSPQLCYFRVRNEAKLSPAYLGYWFRSPEFHGQAGFMMHNTDMAPYLSLRDLGRVKLTLPSFARQRAVAEVLGVLDGKIAADGRLSDFADRLSRERFRAMPKVREVALSQTAWFVNGRNFTKDASGTGRVVIRISELNSGIGMSTVQNDVDAEVDNRARPGDLLFAWSGSLTVKRWFMEEGLVNQHIFKVIPKTGYPLWLVHQLLMTKLPEFRAIAADKATTMGHIQRRHLDEPVALPAADVIRAETQVMAGLWELALAAEKESLTLARLRDTLLPQLMSGKLPVRDAERQVEEVV